MARNDESQQETGQAPRVYSSSAVHKRKTGKQARAAEPAREPAQAQDDSAQDAPVVASSVQTESSNTASVDSVPSGTAPAKQDTVQTDAQPAQDAQPVQSAQDTQSVPQSVQDAQEPSSGQTGQAPEGEGAEQGPSQPQDAEGAASAEDGKAPDDGQETPKPRRRGVRIAAVVVGVVVAIALVYVGYFAASRWLFSDDHAAMQGKWYVAGTAVPVTITEDAILLNDQTSYSYTLDTGAKTITFTFGGMEGEGHYWFSSDKSLLVITDGSDFDATGTALGDMGHDLGVFMDNLFAGGAKTPSGEGITAFSRMPDPNWKPASSSSSAAASDEPSDDDSDASSSDSASSSSSSSASSSDGETSGSSNSSSSSSSGNSSSSSGSSSSSSASSSSDSASSQSAGQDTRQASKQTAQQESED